MKFQNSNKLLDYLNKEFSKLHTKYESLFWISYMGDHSVDKEMNEARQKRDAFNSNTELKNHVDNHLLKAKGNLKKRLESWKKLFSIYQATAEALQIKKRVLELESKVNKIHAERKMGYIDPKTNSFIETSENKMRVIMRTNPDESIRKACFDAMQKMPYDTLDDYIQIIKGRNEFARALGYEDFYDYKIHIDEGMTKAELFSIFDKIYEKTKYGFENIRKLEKEKENLRKPWNYSYMMAGNFVKEEDPYFQFEDALNYWGKSFSALGINFQKGKITLDLLDRKGKYSNGFCHYPLLITYKNNKIVPAASNFTSNAILGQIGAGIQAINTLFHEAGHAADRLNSIQKDACLNSEYPPATVSWAETQSMFMDTISSSIEWKTRYAKDKDGNKYPFELFERKLKAVYPLRALSLMHIIFVVDYERQIYECKDLTSEKVIEIAKNVSNKYFDYSEPSIGVLNVPHIYSWDVSAYYHGYGMAELGVYQWREYFFKKYGYIVDNNKIGQEMTKVWKFGSLFTSKECIKIATGKFLSADSYIKEITLPFDKIIESAKAKIKKLEKIKVNNKKIDLNAKIVLMHGKEKIADNTKGFERMEEKFRNWLKKVK